MYKSIALLVLLVSIAPSAVAAGTVDLTLPGALESLRNQRPEHYRKVSAILALAESHPLSSTARWIEARVGASDVELMQWRVSDPPKLTVSFTLDDTRYTGQVVPVLEPARPVRAHAGPTGGDAERSAR